MYEFATHTKNRIVKFVYCNSYFTVTPLGFVVASPVRQLPSLCSVLLPWQAAHLVKPLSVDEWACWNLEGFLDNCYHLLLRRALLVSILCPRLLQTWVAIVEVFLRSYLFTESCLYQVRYLSRQKNGAQTGKPLYWKSCHKTKKHDCQVAVVMYSHDHSYVW